MLDIRYLINRQIFSVIPELFATAIKGHATASEVNFYRLFINSHNLCDRIFMSVKGFFSRKREFGSLNPVI